MTSKISVSKGLIALFLSSAVLGYTLSFEKLYLFHVVASLYLFFMVFGIVRIKRSDFYYTRWLFAFYAYAVLSLLWAINLKNAMYFLFYFANALVIVFSIVSYSRSVERLNFIFGVLCVFLILNFLVGLVETTGLFRLPVSPYYGTDLSYPSGFNSNLNNFGFVFIAVLPFMVLYPNRLVSSLSLILGVWFAYKLESKGFFLGVLFLLFLLFFSSINKKATWKRFFIVSLGVAALSPFLLLLLSDDISGHRVFTTFDSITQGVELMQDGDMDVRSSTGVRSGIYLYGLMELFKSYGLGLGVAGLGSKLAIETGFFSADLDIFSVHNFFLEMLVDFGVLVFVIIIYAYLSLSFKLIFLSNKTPTPRLAYFSKACGVSLLVILPASISPSSIIYVFTFWIVIGFSISTLRLLQQESYE